METTVVLRNPSGLHARPAALFVACAKQYPGTTVKVRKGEREADARSLLSILTLGISVGSAIQIRTEGAQAEEALHALAALVESGFGESVG